ncbi:MAG: FlgD immunoglobulin-like domain containing protein [candidate division KSB1 bacterium]|nr:FlgD immunoglobulin-like domain containing protein [candidate division KSB1 bacterium]
MELQRNTIHPFINWRRRIKAFVLLGLAAGIFTTAQGQPGPWQAIGPWGAEIQAVAVAPSDPDVLYAADMAGHLYKSTDAGQSWQSLTPVAVAVRALAIDPHNPNHVYIGADIFGVMRTLDGGANWEKYETGLDDDPFVYAIAIHPQNPDIVYAGTFKSKGRGGVYRSADGGRTWQPARRGLRDANVLSLAMDPRRPNILYAGMYKGRHALYRSNDGGQTWKPIDEGIGRQDVFAVVVHPQKSSVIYAATGGAGMFKSENGGASWRPVNRGLINLDVRALILDPGNPDVLYAGGALGIYKTLDGGRQWFRVNRGLTNQIVVKLAIDPRNSARVYAGTLGMKDDKQRGSFIGGIFRTTDAGEEWQWASQGILSADVRAIQFDPFNPEIIYAGVFGYGVFLSTDGGRTWNANEERRNLGLTDPEVLDVSVDPQNPGTVLAATLKGGIYKSQDYGVHWRPVWDKGRVQMLVRPKQRPELIYAASFPVGVLRSEDGGETWESVGLDIPGIFALAVDPTNPDVLYAAINAPPPEGGLYKSTDGGRDWKRLDRDLPNTMFRAIAVHPTKPNIVFVGTLEQKKPSAPAVMYRSMDGGETWERVTEQEFETYVLLIDPNRPHVLYSGKLVKGVFRSADAGVTWEDVNQGLDNTNVLAMAFHPKDSQKLYVGTVRGGIFVRDFGRSAQANAGAEQDVPSLALSFVALPVADGLILQFEAPARRGELNILDATGEVVRTMHVLGNAKGLTEVHWDGRDQQGNELPAGVYVIRMSMGGQTLLKKVLLLRGE